MGVRKVYNQISSVYLFLLQGLVFEVNWVITKERITACQLQADSELIRLAAVFPENVLVGPGVAHRLGLLGMQVE